MATFSFHPVKTIACGEGGMVTTNDDGLAARLRAFRNHGISRDRESFVQPEMAVDAEGNVNPWYYETAHVGFNYRLSDLHAALGLSQLGKLDRFVARRRALVSQYDAGLAGLAPVLRPIARTGDRTAARTAACAPAWHLYPVLIDYDRLGTERSTVMARLRAAGIGSQVHYIPVHLQPCYRARYGGPDLPGAMAYYGKTLTLPLFPAMTDRDVERVVTALAGICGTART